MRTRGRAGCPELTQLGRGDSGRSVHLAVAQALLMACRLLNGAARPNRGDSSMCPVTLAVVALAVACRTPLERWHRPGSLLAAQPPDCGAARGRRPPATSVAP